MGRLLIIPLVLLGLLVGAVMWSGGGVEQRSEFRFINRGDIFTLDINQMSYLQDFRLTYAIREGLYNLDPETYVPVPAGAMSYDLSPDKRIWTFHLRPQAKWSNGDRVVAADYEFSWRRMLEEPGEYTYLFYYIKNAEAYEKGYAGKESAVDFATVGIKAVDDLTFRVTLIDPVPYLLDLVAFPPFYPRHAKSMEPFKIVSDDGKYTYRNEYTRPPSVVTNGPFSLKVWDFKRRLILEQSDQYWDRANVKSKSIEMVVNDNVLSQFLLYEAGDVDWIADVVGELAAELKDKGRKDLRTSPAFGSCFLTFLCQPTLPPSTMSGETGVKNPLADIRVRQALAMAIDKRFIVNTITRMGELPARTYLPPDGTLREFTWLPGPYAKSKDRINAEEFRKLLMAPGGLEGDGPGIQTDYQLAKKLLADAGYADGRNWPAMPILYITSNPTRAKIAQVLKSQWKANLGIDVNVQGVEGKIFSQRCSKKDYAIGIAAWYGDYPDASTFTDKYKSTSLQNDCDWNRPEFDELCAQATREPDTGKRMRLLERAENMIDTEVPIVPLYHYVNVSLSRDNVKGVKANPRQITIFKGVKVEK